jgi:hypothetical protein
MINYGPITEPKLFIRDITGSNYLKFDLAQVETLPFDQYGWYHFTINDHLNMVDV